MKRTLRGFLVAGLSTALALVAAEFFVRQFEIGPRFSPVIANALRLSDNPRLIYELVPGAKAETQWNAVTNSDGMRDREYSLAKPEGTLRIACIGDSICLGWGVSQEDGFTEVMEQDLDRPGLPPVEVLNFGVVGYNIDQIIEALRSKALKYDPDVVVYAYCLNDPLDYSFMETKLRAELNPAQNELWDALQNSTQRGLSRSRLYMLARYVLHSLSPGNDVGSVDVDPMDDPAYAAVSSDRYAQYFSSLYRGDGWHRVQAGFQELSDMTRPSDIHVLIVIFPLFRDLQHYKLLAVHDKVAEEGKAHSFQVLDLLGPYQELSARLGSVEEISMDPVHPNEIGHRLAAEEILSALTQSGAIPKSH